MVLLLAIVLVVTHLYFLFYTATEVGILWALAVMILPILGLYIYYREWHALKTLFFVQLALTILLFILKR